MALTVAVSFHLRTLPAVSSCTQYEQQGQQILHRRVVAAHDGGTHDVRFDYARLKENGVRATREEGEPDEEIEAAIGRLREVYERAVSQIPPGPR